MNVQGQWYLPWITPNNGVGVVVTAAGPTLTAGMSANPAAAYMSAMGNRQAAASYYPGTLSLPQLAGSGLAGAGSQAKLLMTNSLTTTPSASVAHMHPHPQHQQQQQQHQAAVAAAMAAHQFQQQQHQHHQQQQQQQHQQQQQLYFNPATFPYQTFGSQFHPAAAASFLAMTNAANLANVQGLSSAVHAQGLPGHLTGGHPQVNHLLPGQQTLFSVPSTPLSSSVINQSNILNKTPLLKTPNNYKESQCDVTSATAAATLCYSGMKSTAALAALAVGAKRKFEDQELIKTDVKKAKLETKALKAKRPGFTDERYNETSYYHDTESNLRKVYPYYFTFTTFTKGRWVGERILDVFAREFRAHPAAEYERCIRAGTLTVNYEKVDVDYRLKHNDLLANVVHRHEVPVSSEKIRLIHIDEDLVVVNKPASIPVHPCGRYRHNTVVFILAKEHGLKNLRTIHRLDRLTSGLLLFGRNPKKAREMEQQIRTRQVQKEYVCRVDGEFPEQTVICKEPIEVVSYKIGVCKVSSTGKECHTEFKRLSFNGRTSVVLCRPKTGRMHQIRVHLQFLGFPVVNDPLYNHTVFGPEKGRGGNIGKSDEQLIRDLIAIHNAENWLGLDEDGGGQYGPMSPLPLLPASAHLPKSTEQNENSGFRRTDSPDSAVDVQSMSTSADSPSASSSSSTTSDFHVEMSNSTNRSTVSLVDKSSNVDDQDKVTTATQTGIEEADETFDTKKLSIDPHCYECKVKYRDPRPRDLVMFLHAWTYSGPDWKFVTELPDWAKESWVDPPDYLD